MNIKAHYCFSFLFSDMAYSINTALGPALCMHASQLNFFIRPLERQALVYFVLEYHFTV